MKYIAIIGLERSGTTYLGRRISELEGVPLLPELQILHRFAAEPEIPKHPNEFLDYLHSWKKSFLLPTMHRDDFEIYFNSGLSEFELKRSLIHKTLQICSAQLGGSQSHTFVDHSSAAISGGRQLSKYFSSAEFIFLIRDPRAVYASIKKLDWGANTEYEFVAWYGKRVGEILLNYHDFEIDWKRYESLESWPEEPLYNTPQIQSSFIQYTGVQHRKLFSKFDVDSINKWRNELTESEISVIENELAVFFAYFNFLPISREKTFRTFPVMLSAHLRGLGRFLSNTVRNRIRRKNAAKGS